MKDLVLDLLPELNNYDEVYTKTVIKKYDDYMQYTQIPKSCYGFNNQQIIPLSMKKIFQNINLAIEDGYDFIFMFDAYKNVEYLAYLITQAYFKYCIKNDSLLQNILFVDTKILLADYKKLMDYKETDENCSVPFYPFKTLKRDIENAGLVIWNRFSEINTNWEKDKIDELISIRQYKNLSNFYFSIGNIEYLAEKLGKDLLSIIHFDSGFKCNDFEYKDKDLKEGSIFK